MAFEQVMFIQNLMKTIGVKNGLQEAAFCSELMFDAEIKNPVFSSTNTVYIHFIGAKTHNR